MRRLLDLFCGAGGAAMGYHRAGFEVVGVDIESQPNYPFNFILADALDVDGDTFDYILSFDAIHASPPCQANSALAALAQVKAKNHADLIAPTRELLQQTGLPYVIENVVGALLIDPVRLCGSSLGLNVRRHRLFECSFDVMVPSCAHGWQAERFDIYEHGKWRKSPTVAVYGHGGGKSREHWAEAMGIDWMTYNEMAQAIPPAMTELIGHQLMQHLDHEQEGLVA